MVTTINRCMQLMVAALRHGTALVPKQHQETQEPRVCVQYACST